ncbi:hypothetical protein [Oceanobacillus caeni]|uniref:hypothetical protein n=1 Tax=Oceanobacillus caeni TaxID=405946 RepID=UPI00362F2A23
MDNKQDFDGIVKEARQEFWNIIIHLLEKDIDINTILSVLTINRWELEELKSAKDDEATKIAIRLAKEAHRLNLTIKDIEKTTGIKRMKFIGFMKEDVRESESVVLNDCKAKEKSNNPKNMRKSTRLPDDFETPLSKENMNLLKMLRRL